MNIINLKRPKCQKCEQNNAFVSCMGIIVCLECFDKIQKKKKAEQKVWLENI